ncbi:hypothetical protein Tco_1378970, partial [Tanacetum coccineum]
MVARCGREGDDGDECEGGGGGVELVTRMAAGVWGSDDGDGHEGGVMVAAVGRQPEEVEARGGEWIWGSGRSGHEDNIWFWPERSPENFSGGGGRREGWPEILEKMEEEDDVCVGVWRGWRRWIYVGDVVAAAGVAVVMVARCGRECDDGDECEGRGGGVELVTRMAAGVWGSDDGDGHEGGVMVAAVGRQPEEVEARGGEWIWGSGHEDNIWFWPERSPENFSGGGGRRERWPEILEKMEEEDDVC